MGDDVATGRAVLPQILDMTAAPALAETLRGLRGRAVAIDASEVQRLATPCVQVLLAARRGWATEGQGWRVDNPSEAFAATLALMGAEAVCA